MRSAAKLESSSTRCHWPDKKIGQLKKRKLRDTANLAHSIARELPAKGNRPRLLVELAFFPSTSVDTARDVFMNFSNGSDVKLSFRRFFPELEIKNKQIRTTALPRVETKTLPGFNSEEEFTVFARNYYLSSGEFKRSSN